MNFRNYISTRNVQQYFLDNFIWVSTCLYVMGAQGTKFRNENGVDAKLNFQKVQFVEKLNRKKIRRKKNLSNKKGCTRAGKLGEVLNEGNCVDLIARKGEQ